MTEPTANCPIGWRCESCGATGPDLKVTVYDVLGETMCLTVCQTCRGRLPSIMLSTAQKLVEQHRRHLAGPDRPTYRTRPAN